MSSVIILLPNSFITITMKQKMVFVLSLVGAEELANSIEYSGILGTQCRPDSILRL